MRPAAYLLILYGVLSLLTAIQSERTGTIGRWGLTPMPKFFEYSSLSRTVHPKAFRESARFQWIKASLLLVSGFVFLRVIHRLEHRQETLDPFSAEFVGKDSIDELERTLKAEEERRNRPLPPDSQ